MLLLLAGSLVSELIGPLLYRDPLCTPGSLGYSRVLSLTSPALDIHRPLPGDMVYVSQCCVW